MNLIARYARWLHTQWPAGRVEKLPEVHEDGTTNVPGAYVVGDLRGVPLQGEPSDWTSDRDSRSLTGTRRRSEEAKPSSGYHRKPGHCGDQTRRHNTRTGGMCRNPNIPGEDIDNEYGYTRGNSGRIETALAGSFWAWLSLCTQTDFRTMGSKKHVKRVRCAGGSHT